MIEWDGFISNVKSFGISISPFCADGSYPLAYNICIIISIELDIWPTATAGVSFNLFEI
jgi:hypothetical protein